MNKTQKLLLRLQDHRSQRVIFLSHCILNENTRYLGGACRSGCVSEILEKCIQDQTGIVQMPCPEQEAWGGVIKQLLLKAYGSKGTPLYACRSMVVPLLVLYSRWRFWWMARKVFLQIQDYLASGFSVVGVVGVDGSPSCGLNKTLDFRKSFELLAGIEIDTVTLAEANKVVLDCLVDGKGLFINTLQKQLKSRNVNIFFAAHDLVTELEGRKIVLKFQPVCED